MCARPELLYTAPIWATAHLDRLQRVQNKFLRIIFNAPLNTRITDLQEAKMESVDEFMARLLSIAYKRDHMNLLIHDTNNYKIHDLPFKIGCRFLKHFMPINTYK